MMIVSMTIHLLKDEMSDSHADLFSNASAYLENRVYLKLEGFTTWESEISSFRRQIVIDTNHTDLFSNASAYLENRVYLKLRGFTIWESEILQKIDCR
jgi:hypothetical protein